jgi:hypothetical protein
MTFLINSNSHSVELGNIPDQPPAPAASPPLSGAGAAGTAAARGAKPEDIHVAGIRLPRARPVATHLRGAADRVPYDRHARRCWRRHRVSPSAPTLRRTVRSGLPRHDDPPSDGTKSAGDQPGNLWASMLVELISTDHHQFFMPLAVLDQALTLQQRDSLPHDWPECHHLPSHHSSLESPTPQPIQSRHNPANLGVDNQQHPSPREHRGGVSTQGVEQRPAVPRCVPGSAGPAPVQFSPLAGHIGRIGKDHIKPAAPETSQRVPAFNLNGKPTNHGVEPSCPRCPERDIHGHNVTRAGTGRDNSQCTSSGA